jgi:hypothetical protein
MTAPRTKARSHVSWLGLLLALCLPFDPACQCSGNGIIEQRGYSARPGDDVVNCNCNLRFKNEHCTDNTCLEHFALQLCLPPALQAAASDDGGATVGSDLGADEHSRLVDAYCRDTATKVVYHLIKVFNGGWCDYKTPYAADGGIGQSVECFAEPISDQSASATGLDDGTCATTCAPVECDYATNCGSDVQDSLGNIHLDHCRCSYVARYACPGDDPSDLPTPLFCRPPDGVALK